VTEAGLIAALALLAGGLALDATAAFQLMLSQPIVSGTLAGLVTGDLGTGLAIGATLQLVWLGVLPVGAAPFPDTAVATVVGVGVARTLTAAGSGAGWAIGIAVVVSLLTGAVGQWLIARVRRLNMRLADMAIARAERGDSRGIGLAVALALGARFAAGAALAAVVLVVTSVVAGHAAPVGGPAHYPALVWAAPLGAAWMAARARGREVWAFLGLGVAGGIALTSL